MTRKDLAALVVIFEDLTTYAHDCDDETLEKLAKMGSMILDRSIVDMGIRESRKYEIAMAHGLKERIALCGCSVFLPEGAPVSCPEHE